MKVINKRLLKTHHYDCKRVHNYLVTINQSRYISNGHAKSATFASSCLSSHSHGAVDGVWVSGEFARISKVGLKGEFVKLYATDGNRSSVWTNLTHDEVPSCFPGTRFEEQSSNSDNEPLKVSAMEDESDSDNKPLELGASNPE